MTTAVPVSSFDWFAYYSLLREYKDNLEQRFQALLFQEGLVAVATVSIVLALDDKLNRLVLGFPIGAVSTLVIGVYSFLTSRYFRQVREVGLLMARIEEERLGLDRNWGIKLRLSTDTKLSIFTCGRTPIRCKAYSLILITIVLAMSVLYPLLAGR